MDSTKNDNMLIQVVPISLETMTNYIGGSFVYALLHSNMKLVQVVGTSNVLVSLGRLLEEIGKSNGEYTKIQEEIDKTQVVILETTSKEELQIRLSHWRQYYKDLGYEFFKDVASVRYSLETRYEYRQGKMHCFLYAVNKRKDRKLLGIFGKKRLLEEFIQVAYPDNRIERLVYHESSRESPSSRGSKRSKA